MRLVLCPDCQRHLRDDAASCPFCGKRNDALVAAPERVTRLGRAAIMAFGVATTAVVGLDGCHKEPENIAQPYGAPPDPTVAPTAQDAAPLGTPPETAIAMPYGAPPQNPDPPVDAGAAKDASVAKDAGAPKKDAGVATTQTATVPTVDPRSIKKPYGAPPIPEGDDYV